MKLVIYSGTLFGSSILAVLLTWYVVVLLVRTHFGSQPTSVGQDVIWIVYVTALVACTLAVASCFLRPTEKLWGMLIAIATALPTLAFAALHLLGRVGQYIKQG
jgi:hypothetical protein